MDLKHIKELMAAMGRTGMKKLQIKRNDFELNLERGDNMSNPRIGELFADIPDEHRMMSAARDRTDQALSRGSDMIAPPPASPIHVDPPKVDAPGTTINSPIVGTFYLAPSPDDPPFVKVGDKVDKQDVVCIIEAMKVMNEIKAGVSGTIVEILVESGHPVEFGTKLFRIV